MPSIRRATLADLSAICLLGNDVNRLHHEVWPHLFSAVSELERDAAHWRYGIEHAGCFIAEDNAGVVGFITGQICLDESTMLVKMSYCRIWTVCVAPTRRGQGIGQRLMAELENWAHGEQAAEIRLNVFAFNHRAIKLYQELGFATRSMTMGKQLPSNA